MVLCVASSESDRKKTGRYRFFKHNNEWRYIEKGVYQSNSVGTHALECVLGVTGTRKAVVFCKQPDNSELQVTVENGFITKVEEVHEGTDCVYTEDGGEQCYPTFDRYDKTEFFAEEC